MNKNNLFSKLLLTLISSTFCFVFAQAQMGKIEGIVKDAGGNSLAGASITIKGKTNGTTTDAKGYYAIQIAPGTYELATSFVGQITASNSVTVSAGKTTTNDVTLNTAADLAVVQVIGTRNLRRVSTETDRKSTRLNSSHLRLSRMPSSA